MRVLRLGELTLQGAKKEKKTREKKSPSGRSSGYVQTQRGPDMGHKGGIETLKDVTKTQSSSALSSGFIILGEGGPGDGDEQGAQKSKSPDPLPI